MAVRSDRHISIVSIILSIAPSTTDATNSNATAIGVAMALILLVVFAAITAVVVGIAVVLTKREKMKRLVIDEDIAGYDNLIVATLHAYVVEPHCQSMFMPARTNNMIDT